MPLLQDIVHRRPAARLPAGERARRSRFDKRRAMRRMPLNYDESSALLGLLQWYAAMGVDMAVDADPHDRFAECASAPAATAPRGERPTAAPERVLSRAAPQMPPGAATSAEGIFQSAQESAAAARTLEDLRARLLAFEGCGLKTTATQLVFADGNPQAKIMLVGEAPGADEDRQGLPFVGRAGQLLNKMLAAIGLDRTQVYIANVVPWRPPGNRTPTPIEIGACLPFTRRQIELVNPKILVCLGAPSTQTLLGPSEGIMRLRGRWHQYDLAGRRIPARAMLHPAYLLRQPAHKKLAWQDLRELAKAIAELGDANDE
jgi:uracil-DNA glycosylase